MTMENETIETLVLEAIRGGNRRAKAIEHHVRITMGDHGRSVDFRTIDRALQRLRKKGAITYDTGRGWSATGVCDHA